jgi:glycosyltransferase involved in cell wall biosynthesis
VSADTAIHVTAWRGQHDWRDLEREAARGIRPRTDYVELARRIGAHVVDGPFLLERAARPARALASRGHFDTAHVTEALIRRRRFGRVIAWSDSVGASLGLLSKLHGGKTDLVLVSVWLATPRKALALRRLRLHTAFRAIVMYSSTQIARAEGLGVPSAKLHHGLHPVDERFWRPRPLPVEPAACAVGWEARDYATLLEAARGLDVRLEIAIGSSVQGGARADARQSLASAPANVSVHRGLTPAEVRELYARSTVAIVPLIDVEYDAGVTAVTEAMAMARPVVVTRTRGQRDVVTDGREGVYVRARDAGGLREAIGGLISDRGRATEMGRAGRAAAETTHALDRYVAWLASVVLGRNEPSSRDG